MTPALQLLLKHGFAVFPCTPNGKIPYPGTKGFKDATKDPDAVTRMFGQRPGSNVAIATGAVSGIFVLDVDQHSAEADGSESLKELEKIHGALPDTVEVLTPSGGRHLYFKHVEGLRNRAAVRPGLDVRGHAGYVLCPPSSIDGHGYAWEASSHPDDVAVATAPAWLVDLLKAPAEVPSTAPLAPGSTNAPTTAKFTAGSRNDKLTREAGKLRAHGLEATALIMALRDINAKRCEPPLPDAEVVTIATSIAKRPEKGQTKPVDFVKRPHDELWNADMFHKMNAEDVRFCAKMKVWYFWRLKVWAPDEMQEIRYRGRQVVEEIYRMAEDKRDEDLFKHAKRSATNSQIKSFLEIASSHREIAVRADDFDHTHNSLNCASGVIDFLTGEIMPHDRNLLFTKIANTPYLPGTPCPEWLNVLNMAFCGHQDTVAWFQRAVGYAISGSMEEQAMFILHGPGMNGKSTILKALVRILGSYAQNASPDTFLEQQGSRNLNDIARMKGARFITTSETPEGKKLSEARVKQLTSDDPITGRFLFSEEFDFIPTGKIFMATNHKPRITGTDKGIKRRLKLIPFRHIITPEERDAKLDDKLKAEDAGIFAWMIEGNKLWRENGLGTCQDVEDYTEEFFEESDYIGEYINENCVIGVECAVKSDLLWKDFCEWALRNGIMHPSRMKFIDYLKSKGMVKKQGTSGMNKARILWFGIGLKSDPELIDNSVEGDTRPY
jgi:putative DNA primase/helicase